MIKFQLKAYSVAVLTIMLAVSLAGTHAFLTGSHPFVRFSTVSTTTPTTTSSSLFYTNYTFHTQQPSALAGGTAADPPKKLEIPVIGPLLNVPKPLLIGESMWLNPPTPLQWKTIETCVEAQHKAIQEEQQQRQQQQPLSPGGGLSSPSTDSTINNNSVLGMNSFATIDQSPLVAVLHKDGNDLATIAAIVGIVTREEGSIDTTSAESFRESLAMLQSPYYSDHSRVRLIGIGRAKLTRFSVMVNEGQPDIDNPYNDVAAMDVDENSDGPIHEPLLMAQMELLLDSNEHGQASSPVHALNQLSVLTARIRFLHKDRQKIVRGLQAAQARLEMAMEEWEDYDGIGALYEENGNKAMEDQPPISNEDLQMTLHSFLREFNQDTTADPMASSRPLSPGAANCVHMDNFGLGTSPTAYADLIPMSEVLVERLQPFFSPQRSQTEEFAYEAFSWVALESLKLYLLSETITEALESSNTCERLEVLYHAMLSHKRDLTELAKAKSQELLDCGEECAGLF